MRFEYWKKIWLTGICAAGILMCGCGKINMENYENIKVGMNYGEIKNLLGDADECAGAIGMKTCRWGSETKQIQVQFIADKVVAYSQKGL